VLPGSGGTVSFKYDPFGRRIQKSTASATTNYLYDGNDLLEEVDQAGSVIARYIRTQQMDEVLSQMRTGVTSYYEADGTDSITSLSSSTGTLANTYTYDSFGNLISSAGTIANPFRYTSREFDSETGIYEYRARYYDQNQGRFISEDPSGIQGGLHLYKYVQNNPLILIDPTGLSAQGAWQGAKDLTCYILGGYCNTFHSNDAVTADLANTAAMNDIRRKYRNNHCADGLYCGAFGPKQVLTTWNFVGQIVGGFCAYMTNLGGGETQVDAFNDWGAASGSRNPTANRNNPSFWDMLVNHAPIKNPSTLWNDWYGGPLGKQRFWYHWTEQGTCCGS
jgi:RHS repeat-associated protein